MPHLTDNSEARAGTITEPQSGGRKKQGEMTQKLVMEAVYTYLLSPSLSS